MRVLVGMICPLVGPPLEVAQFLRLVLPLGYAPSEVVSLVGGAALVNISASCLRYAVFFSPDDVSDLVGVGLMRAWVSSSAACFAASFEDILGKVSVSGLKYLVSETLYLAVLGMHDVRQR